MKEHVIDLVDLYLDGEMDGKEALTVEMHLRHCSECEQFYARRRRLSEVIQEPPVPSQRISDRQFTAGVMTKLETQTPAAFPKNSLTDWSWIIIPVLLVIGLAFIQAVWVESNLVQFVPQVGEALEPGQFFLPFSFALPAVVTQFIKFLLDLNLWSWDWSSALLISAALSLIYVSWLAGWWVKGQKRSGNFNQDMELSNEPSSNS